MSAGSGFLHIVFVIKYGQLVNHNFEIRIGIRSYRLTHNLKLDRILTFGAAGKNMAGKQGDLVRQTVPRMDHFVNAAFGDGLAGMEFLSVHPAFPLAAIDAGCLEQFRCDSRAAGCI